MRSERSKCIIMSTEICLNSLMLDLTFLIWYPNTGYGMLNDSASCLNISHTFSHLEGLFALPCVRVPDADQPVRGLVSDHQHFALCTHHRPRGGLRLGRGVNSNSSILSLTRDSAARL